jgi:uncharacterized protein (DUF2384 family)
MRILLIGIVKKNGIMMVDFALEGEHVFAKEVTSEADLTRPISRRIPLRVLTYVKRGGFSDQIRQFIIPERTQRHRKAKKQPLTIEESDRVVRLTRIQVLAEDVLGDKQKANSGGCAKN